MTSRKVRARPRTVPRQPRAAATVDAVLIAAAEAFARDGFRAANINAIASRAGVSVGSLYRYYPSKEAVLVALIERHTADTLGALEAEVVAVAAEPLPVAVRRVVAAMVEAHRSPLHRTLARELDELGRLGELVDEVDRRAGRAVIRFFAAHRAELRPLDEELAAFLLVRAIDGLTHAVVVDRPQAVDQLVDELVRMVLGYLERRA